MKYRILFLMCGVISISACGDDTPSAEPVCIPGIVQSCPCPGGELTGVQTCAKDGASFGPCDCDPYSSDTEMATASAADPNGTFTDTENQTDSDSEYQPVGGSSYLYALTAMYQASSGNGNDINGDGTIDNALAPLADALFPILTALVGTTQPFGVLELSGVDAWTDASIGLRIAQAELSDGTLADLHTGTATVSLVGPHVPYTETNLYADGYFNTLIAQGNILLGTRLVAPSMGINVWGTVTDTDALQLLITFPLPIAELTTLLAENGASEQLIMDVVSLADLDLDNDDVIDSISIAWDCRGTRVNRGN